MKKLRNTFFLILIFLVSKVTAQADCILGVGITNDSIISDVFQLNSEQAQQLANYAAELKYRKELLNNQLENYQKRQPQSTVIELTKLAEKYKSVMDSMQSVQGLIDRKMLALFNDRQYQLYRTLCREATRSPFLVVPKVYSDTIKTRN